MSSEAAVTDTAPSRPIAMVSLDGGGVRGLSSLLILRLLLLLVTEELARRNAIPTNCATLNPQDVFDIAVGTSTGGLIVLMLVKLNMSIDECIEQYKILSGRIFAKERPTLQRMFGDWSKFSGRELQKAIENLLASRGQPYDLKMRSAHANSMQGTVLCHERPNPHPIFFCTHECQGPYREQMLSCDLELRQAARATSAAPSYFEPMIIRGRSFTDGGIGETNNPSWEGKLHYHKNHGLEEDEQLVMINIGTGTLPEDFFTKPLPTRPWWTRMVPNGVVNALGLVSDLVKIATDSEQRAIDLSYISSIIPEQFFFERFSADTGIHHIKLDNWRAVKDTDGPSELEVKTNAYLKKPEVRERLVTAAKKLADVYITRNKAASSPSRGRASEEIPVIASAVGSREDLARVDLTIQLGYDGSLPAGRGRRSSKRASIPVLLSPTAGAGAGAGAGASAGDKAPSLVTSSDDPTRSPETSSPPTPDPTRKSLVKQPEITIEPEEFLQGEGDQFEPKDVPITPLSSLTTSARSPTRKPKRASTYPPRSSPILDE
ncbi:hypothetical protein H2202_005072 [Exophiala xenobiotica]|nr:hypothetical protein H2202_005072 [Exophiala xenobiotica]KAK5205446.1 hypothetical protein LTR41_008900 [Exophiala xenobiotica]KAK5413385.1 hypothetical protein LTR06_004812 [Exophiala xenobiotica]KAK5555248.1 hypothetical protein LTR46_006878 [Exophiala xenobiotica]